MWKEQIFISISKSVRISAIHVCVVSIGPDAKGI